jgi:hypothetical protein
MRSYGNGIRRTDLDRAFGRRTLHDPDIERGRSPADAGDG